MKRLSTHLTENQQKWVPCHTKKNSMDAILKHGGSSENIKRHIKETSTCLLKCLVKHENALVSQETILFFFLVPDVYLVQISTSQYQPITGSPCI